LGAWVFSTGRHAVFGGLFGVIRHRSAALTSLLSEIRQQRWLFTLFPLFTGITCRGRTRFLFFSHPLIHFSIHTPYTLCGKTTLDTVFGSDRLCITVPKRNMVITRLQCPRGVVRYTRLREVGVPSGNNKVGFRIHHTLNFPPRV